MPRPYDHEKRANLLAEATEILARTGIVDTSLRGLAAEMGTSARMLIHYFGSKDELILAVLGHQRRHILLDLVLPTSIETHKAWCHQDWWLTTRGERRHTSRVLLQVFGAACGQDSPYATYARETLTRLTRNSQARLEALGMPRQVAETRSRLAIAATQGLVIRFFTEDDPTSVDDAHRALVEDFLLAPFEPDPPAPTSDK